MTTLVLSLLLAVTGCTGLVLAGRGMWQGWALGLAAQPVWAAFAIVTRGYGLLATCLMYGAVYVRNLRAWRRDAADRHAPPACRHPSVWMNTVEMTALCNTCRADVPVTDLTTGASA